MILLVEEFPTLLRAIVESDNSVRERHVSGAAEWLAEKEASHLVLLSYSMAEPFLEFYDENWVASHLYPFLSVINFPLSGEEIGMCSVHNASGAELDVTFRHWGEVFAQWANLNWHRKPAFVTSWNYVDFYMAQNFERYFSDYQRLLGAFRCVVNRKDEKFGFHLNNAVKFA